MPRSPCLQPPIVVAGRPFLTQEVVPHWLVHQLTSSLKLYQHPDVPRPRRRGIVCKSFSYIYIRFSPSQKVTFRIMSLTTWHGVTVSC